MAYLGSIKNTQRGIRGVNTVDGPLDIEPGATVDDVELSDGEYRVAKRTGWFEFGDESGGGGSGDPDGGKSADDLDTTIAKLREIAAAEGVDLSGLTAKADIQAAIRAAREAKASGADELDGLDDDTLRTTVAALTGKSVDELAETDRAGLLALARAK